MEGELHIVSEGDHIDPNIGFIEGNPNNFITVGDEKRILESMRQRGWSEEALQALKSGKSIRRNIEYPPFGIIPDNEQWVGKTNQEDI